MVQMSVILHKLEEIDRKLDILMGKAEQPNPGFKLSPVPPRKQTQHRQIVAMFEEEFRASKPNFRIRSMVKWEKDARRLEKLGYSLEDLREMVRFVLEDESVNGEWKGWRHVIKNIEDFTRSAGKIESALARQNEYLSQYRVDEKSKWL